MAGYFEWLKSQVDFLDFPEKYERLFTALYGMEFVWRHPMDRNRAFDALELRNLYFEETGHKALNTFANSNVLELIISIARRMNFICSSFNEDKTKIIFWRLIANLDLAMMSDPEYNRSGGDSRVHSIIDRFLNRQYEPTGEGGLFPMQNPREDQREVEIWYQMNQYLSDPNGEDLKSY